jgi:hypothetical protein
MGMAVVGAGNRLPRSDNGPNFVHIRVRVAGNSLAVQKVNMPHPGPPALQLALLYKGKGQSWATAYLVHRVSYRVAPVGEWPEAF